MSFTRTFIAAVAVSIAAVMAGAGSAPALGAPTAKAAAAEAREVCVASAYVRKRPGVFPVGSVFKGERVRVERHSDSRAWARVVAIRPGLTIRGWTHVANLCPRGTSARFAQTARYSVTVARSRAGGDPGYYHVGGSVSITVHDRRRAGQSVELCIMPAPDQKPACRSANTGRRIEAIALSQSQRTTLQITIAGGPTLTDSIVVYPGAARRGSFR